MISVVDKGRSLEPRGATETTERGKNIPDCSPARILFAAEGRAGSFVVSISECLTGKQDAAHLLRVLLIVRRGQAAGHFEELALQAAPLREAARRDAQVQEVSQQSGDDGILLDALRG